MALPSSVVLVCAGADTTQAAASGRPLLDLCLGLNDCGAPVRFSLPQSPTPLFLGMRDVGQAAAKSNPEEVARAVLYECGRIGATGLFADFETNAPGVARLCATLDHVFHEQNMPLFFPASRGPQVKHAILTFETAVSGGSLLGMVQEARETYGKERVASLLQPVCADFCLPSNSPDGTPLTRDACEALRASHDAQVFFSRELCAKYFTYMDAAQRGHFVLFDDDTTIENKFSCLQRAEVPYMFALYPDVAHML